MCAGSSIIALSDTFHLSYKISTISSSTILIRLGLAMSNHRKSPQESNRSGIHNESLTNSDQYRKFRKIHNSHIDKEAFSFSPATLHDLKTTDPRLYSFLDNMPFLVIAYDNERKIAFWNKECEKVTGYTKSEIVDNPKAPNLLFSCNSVCTQLQEKNILKDCLYDIACSHGSSRSISWSTLSNEYITVIVGVDVTDSMLNEKALRESEENLEITLNSLGDAVITTNGKGNITRMNPLAEKLTGWSLAEAIGRSLKDVFILVNDYDTRIIENPYTAILKDDGIPEIETPLQLRTRNMKKHKISFTGAPIIGKESETLGLVVIFRDITKKLRLEEDPQNAQTMESTGKLAGGIAHDFNNLLGGIISYAELLCSYLPKQNEDHAMAEKIINISLRAAKLVRQLLDFSRKGKSQSIRLDIHEIIRETMSILSRTIDRRIDINMELKADISETMGDPSQIENVILNLAINARDAMPDGGKLNITTLRTDLDRESCQEQSFNLSPGEYIKISISDTGCGMDRELKNLIFEPFFSTKELGKGTGMGLSTAYGSIKAHGGAIDVYSKQNEGSTFHVYLPLVHVKDEVSSSKKSKQIYYGHGVVLLVDDEISIVNSMSKSLTGLGYEVITACDGEQAVEKFLASKGDIDLVIMDLIMPKMSGAEAFRLMRMIDPDVNILISSGYSSDTEISQLISEGACGFIQKPFTMCSVSKIIAKILQGASDQ